MRIYDCFTFYNEYDLLEWRLRLLYNIVDVFVIVEADRTFQNNSKPFNFLQAEQRFAPYKDKIRYIKLSGDIPYTSDWSIEIFQRNNISQGLYDCQPEDIVMISDVDEIMDPRVLNKIIDNKIGVSFFPDTYLKERAGIRGLSRNTRCLLKNLGSFTKRQHILDVMQNTPVVCAEEMFEFFINYKCRFTWCGLILSYFKNLTTPQKLRDQRNLLPMVNGGWHFSSLGGVKAIKNKLRSTSDGMKNPVLKLPEEQQDEYIARELSAGRIWWTNEPLKKCSINELDIPEITWFSEKFPYMKC